jgi:chitodextrinase
MAMKKVLLFAWLITMGVYVYAQNPPTSSPNPYNYNNNNTNIPKITRSGYYDKANNGARLLANINGQWNSQNTEPYIPYTVSSPNIDGAINCRILFPINYNPNDGKKYPVVLFLHGKGEAGRNDLYHGTLPCDGPPCIDNNELELLWWGYESIRANTGGEQYNLNYDDRRSAFWIFPQNGGGYWPDGHQEGGFFQFINPATGQPWESNGHSRAVMNLIEYLSTGEAVASNGVKFNVDPNRIYIHGLSAGGGGTYDFIYRRPDLFAAAIPYSAGGDRSDYVANRMRHMPIWMWQGGRDDNPCTSVSYEVYNKYITTAPVRRDNQALFKTYDSNSQAGGQYPGCSYIGSSKDLYNGNKRYTVVPTQGHGCWFDAYDHPDLFRWLFSQSKLTINAFSDTVNCAGGSVRIGIGEGFAEYQWKRDNTILTFPATANEVDVDVAGWYYVRIKRKNPYTNVVGDWSEWSAPIQIVSGGGSGAGKPTISANNSLILPSLAGSTVTLTASDGYSSYAWSKDGAPIAGATSKTLAVNAAGSYTVKGTIATCTSPASESVIVRTSNGANPPNGNPSGLSATGITASSIQLNWTDGSSNETAFEIYRATTAGGPTYTFLGTVAANVTTFTNTGLTPNNFYYYRVRAVNADGSSAYTNEASAEPLPDTEAPTIPTGLLATNISGNTLTLNWTASTDNVAVIGYDIFQDGVQIGSSPGTSFNVTGLASATDYVFRVRAKDFRNNLSALSNPLSVTTLDLSSGIVNYTYYESSSSYFNMPDFNSLTEKKKGVVNNFSIAPRDREEFFQFKFESKLQITTAGAYTFYTTSDDGSVLYIDGTLVVNNDGAHSSQERSGNITLTAGLHDIRVQYYNNAGTFGTVLEVRWESSAAGVTKQIIPGSVLLGFPVPKVFYPKTSGDITVLATWGLNTDGTGEAPASFTANQQTFNLNRSTTLAGNWTISGNQSKLVIANGITLNTSSFGINGTAKVNLEGNATLVIGGSTTPNLGILSTNSTVDFAFETPVPNNITYGNLTLSGIGVKSFIAGNYNIDGNLRYSGGVILGGTGTILNLKGNFILNGTLSLPVTLNFTGITQTFTGNGNDFEVQNFRLNVGTTLSLSNLGGSSGLRVLNGISMPTGSVLEILPNTTFTIAGNAAMNSSGETGLIKSNSGRIIINATSSNNSNLYFSPAGNTLQDLVINETGTGKVFLKSTLNLTGTLNLDNGTLNTSGGNLVFVSNIAGTARIAKVNNGNIEGNITVQRFVDRNNNLSDPNQTKGWFHLGTSVKGQKVIDWADNAYLQGFWLSGAKSPSIYTYHEYEYNTANLPPTSVYYTTKEGWYGITGPEQSLNVGQGVKMYFYNEFFTNRPAVLDNTGEPVIGEFDFGVTYSPATGWQGGGWNFVANPYVSDIDWTNASGWTKTGILNTIYIWDARANQGKGNYQVCSIDGNGQMTLAGGATGRIASGQAFFVRANAANSVLKINENAKTITNTSFLRTTALTDGLRIKIVNKDNDSDEAIIKVNKNAKNSFDENFDAYKLKGGSVYISSLSKDGIDLAINTIANMSDTVYLNLAENVKGSYSLCFSDLESFAAGTRIYLYDKLTQQTVDIFSQPNYSFTITETVGAGTKSRFALIMKAPEGNIRISGNVKTPGGNAIKGVGVKLISDSFSEKVVTLADGAFSFTPQFFDTYSLSVENNSIKPDITVLDLILANRYLNHKATLTPYQIIAGDVDNTHTFTIEDITWMEEYMLGHAQNLPKYKGWEFIPKDFTFKDSQNPFPYQTAKIVRNNQSIQTDFIGVATGKLGALPELQKEAVSFIIDDVSCLPGQTITIPVRVKNFKDISGYQFALKWNKAILEFVDVKNLSFRNRFGILKVKEGVLTSIWADNSGESVSLADGTQLFEITFKVVGTAGSSTSFFNNIESISNVILNKNLQSLGLEFKTADLKIVNEGEGFNTYPNVPNPFDTETMISFNVPESARVTIKIYNSLGKEVDAFDYNANTGRNNLSWNPGSKGKYADSGIYVYSITYKSQIIHNKMLIVR